MRFDSAPGVEDVEQGSGHGGPHLVPAVGERAGPHHGQSRTGGHHPPGDDKPRSRVSAAGRVVAPCLTPTAPLDPGATPGHPAHASANVPTIT